jgi:hypothetical protein
MRWGAGRTSVFAGKEGKASMGIPVLGQGRGDVLDSLLSAVGSPSAAKAVILSQEGHMRIFRSSVVLALVVASFSLVHFLAVPASAKGAKGEPSQKLMIPEGWVILDAQFGVGGQRSFYTIRAKDPSSGKVYLLVYEALSDEQPRFHAVIEHAPKEEVFKK